MYLGVVMRLLRPSKATSCRNTRGSFLAIATESSQLLRILKRATFQRFVSRHVHSRLRLRNRQMHPHE